MGKALENKKHKIHAIMDAGYALYSKKGVNDTTVGDITSAAGVAKGTFYLYFKDKFELHDRLVISKSSKLFVNAYQKLSHEVRINNNQELHLPENAILFMMKDILDVLKEDRDLLRFLHKDLALGIFNNFEENELLAEENPDFIAMYRRILSLSNERFRNSKVMLFLIIELVSSTAYTSIMYGDSLISLGELMPYLHETIHDIMERNRIISVEELPYNERNRAELKDN